MKNSQMYILLGGMCFVGSLLTNHLWDSLLLIGMMLFWHILAIIIIPKENELEMLEMRLEERKRIK